jgi:hypothetical protein
MKGRFRDAALWAALVLVGWLPFVVQAQIGVTVCACQPSVYVFELDFNATCDIGTIDSRPGIRGADCFARGIGLYADDTVDFVPVQVTSISIVETNREFQVLAQSPYSSFFSDGDKITYTSILGTPEGVASLDEDNLPAGMQVDIVGINQLEQPITNVWIILFDNVCGVFPVLEKGDKIGWTIINDIRLPYNSVCPIAGSVAPTPSPRSPTFSPSSEPSKAKASSEPSKAKAAIPALEEPTAYPSGIPSEAPYEEAAPVCVPGRGKSGHRKSGKSGRSSGKAGKAGSGKAGSGKAGSGKADSGKAGSGKAGSGKARGLETHDGELRDPTNDTAMINVRDFYRFGVTTRGVGHDRDRDETDPHDTGNGKVSSSSTKSAAPDDDEYECLPPKKKKVSEKDSAKKLKKQGKASKGNGKGSKAEGDDDGYNEDAFGKGGGKSGGEGGAKSSGKGGSGKGGSGKGGKAGTKLTKKLMDNSRSDKLKKLTKDEASVSEKESKSVVRPPAARPVVADAAPPSKSPPGVTSAPSITPGTLNMEQLESQISRWFQQHTEQDTGGDTDRRRLRR